MKKLIALFLCLLLCGAAVAEEAAPAYACVDYSSGGYTISLRWEEGIAEDAELREKLLNVFFDKYPAIRETFGTTEERTLVLHLTTGTDNHINSAEGVFMSYDALKNDPSAINTLVWFFANQVTNGHPNPENDPEISTLSSGVMFYMANRYAANTDALVWMPPYAEGQQLTENGQVAAAFITWVAQTYGDAVPVRLNRVLHEGCYDHHDFWTGAVGNTLENLWQQYAENHAAE